MPASSSNLINSALHLALSKKGTGGSKNSISDIEEQLNASTKQIFLHDIEYECSTAPQSFVLNNLKSKYVNVISKGKQNNQNTLCPKLQKNKMAYSRNEDKLEEPRVTLWAPDKVVLGWQKNFPPGAGMINLGNTCYMNSSLQALFHIPSLVNWLLEEINTHIPSCETNTQNASFCSICGMMRTLKLALDRGNSVIKPSFIHNKLKSIGKTLMYGRQEDAHEFIKLLLDHMEKSFLQYKRATKLDHRSKETTPLNQIFGGYLRQQVICPLCCYVSTTFSHFQDLVLDIRSVGSVDEALNLYFRKETLDSDNAYKCEKCHKKVPATKRHLIERAPHVLLLQLKRFTISGGKITKHVNIQKNIDISKYVNGVKPTQPNGTGPYFYRLVSMVIHIGSSQHGGHYTAIAEASNNTMFEFDDASVRPISVHSALLRNPYILFYEMVRKPKGVPCLKQVIRQSSEKALLRQSSSDKITKPFPTSLSASCMWNGVESPSDNIGEAESRNGLISENKKSPLLSQRDRERISFGMKTNSNLNRAQDSSKFPKMGPLGPHNGIHYKTSIPSNSNSGVPSSSSSSTTTTTSSSSSSSSSSTTTSSSSSTTSTSSSSSSSNVKNGQPSSLVPYNDDSDDSGNGKELNGHHIKYQENGHVKATKWSEKGYEKNSGASSSNSVYGIKSSNKSSKSTGSSPDVRKSKNVDATTDEKSNKGAKPGDSRVEENANCRVSEEKEYNFPSSGTLKNSGKQQPLLPRSLQVQSVVNGKDPIAAGSKINGYVKLVNTDSVHKQAKYKDEKDARINSQHRANEGSSFLNGSKLKNDNGWIVTESNERSPSESSSCSSSSSQGFLVTEKHKSKNKQPEKTGKERDSYNGWTVTVQSGKHDCEKSLSQDYISTSKRQTPDKSETASLKSKESLDSNRSDKSTKSMKKSFFSLFPCVSSSQSPDLSPEEEQTNSVIENKVNSPVKTDPKRNSSLEDFTKEGAPPRPELGSSLIENESSDDDIFQLKRNRDNDENEPASPLKKCRPEDKRASDPACANRNDEGIENTPESRVTDRLQTQKDGEEENSEPKPAKGSPSAPAQHSLPSFNCNKNERNLSTRDEENFSMEEKKSRHKRKNKQTASDSNSYLTKGSIEHLAPTSGERETSRLNHNVLPVEWNRHLKDLSHDLRCMKSKIQTEHTKRHCAWDGAADLSVVNALKKAGELPFGMKLYTWDGRESLLSEETQQERNEARKRTSAELYDDEVDKGKTAKKRHRMHLYDESTNHKENPFQKFQNNFINKQNFGYGHFRSNSYGGSDIASASTSAKNGMSNSRHNSYPYSRKFSNNSNNHRRNSWHSATLHFCSQNNYWGDSFNNPRNRPNHWHQKSGSRREKFYSRKREKFRFQNYSRH